MEKIINEARAVQIEMEKSLRNFLPLNQSKYWLETNNAQREIIHSNFIELKKVVARLLILVQNNNTQPDLEITESWDSNFLK